MRIVFINNTAETFTPTQSGAVATHIWECCRAAGEEGVEPIVISISCAAAPYADVPSILLEPPWVPKDPLSQRILRAQRKLTGWRHLRQKTYAKRVAAAIRRAGLAEETMILHNDPEMAVYLRGQFPRAVLIHHFHNLLETRPQFRPRFKDSVNTVTAVSGFVSKWVADYYGCASVSTVYNGVDSDRFSPGRTDGGAGLPMISFIGRTGIEKAPDLLLRAALRLAEKTRAFRVQIVGSNHWQKFEWDDYQRELTDLSGQLEQQGILVNRIGHVDRQGLPAALRKADIHVVPSRWEEPCALVIGEGMACGLATVASRTGGTPEVVGDAGLLFERDSVEELAAHLFKLVSNRELRLEYGRKARARAREFTWERTWDGFRTVCGGEAAPAFFKAPEHAMLS